MKTTALFQLSYGLFVLTAHDGKDNGCIINTVQQVADSPLRISTTVNKRNHTHDMIMKTGKFNVSILSEQVSFDLFRHFGFQSGRDVDKFADFTDYARSENGLVYLTGPVNAYLSGQVVQTVDLGTHTLFIADLVDAESLNSAPSITYAYYHKNIKPKPESVKVKGWRCKICGYIYEGDPLPDDFICPLCKHGAADFEKIE